MSTSMYKPTIEGPSGSIRRAASAHPAFKPEIARSLRLYPKLAGIVAAVVLVLLVAVALEQKAAYVAEALVYIEPSSAKVLADGSGGAFDAAKYESSVAQQMLTAQRVDILANALKSLPHQVWAVYGATPQQAATVLQGQLKVARVSTSYQVSISLKGSDAQHTAAIVNAVTSAYLEAGRKDEISQADQRSQLLREERTRIEAELQQDRAEQTRLGTALGVATPGGDGANPYDTQLDALRSQLVTARAAHDQAASQLAAISGPGGNHASGLTAAANDVIAADSGLGSMKATINARRAQLATQMAGLTPQNPVYKSDQDELADLDRTLETMTVQMRDRAARNLQDKLRADLERTGGIEARTNGELAHMASLATSASPRLQRAAELTADVERLTARYTLVDNALHGLELETTGPGGAHLALAAAVPLAPEANKRRLILLAALPLALLCGLGAAVFASKRDKHIYTGADLDEVLGFAPIAVLPATDDVPADVLDEYYLRLAAGVEGAYRKGSARTFLVTPVSAESAVGPLVRALHRRLLALGLRVAVVDAATVFAPEVPELATTELAAVEPMGERHSDGLAVTLFARLKREYDVVLVESAALLISAQAEYVARCADVTLLVADSAVTTRAELFQAGALLERLHVTGVGAVLTGLALRHADGLFVRGIRALEQRGGRPVTAQAEPVPEASFAEARSLREPVVVEPAPEFVAEPAVEMASGDEGEFLAPEEVPVVAPVAELQQGELGRLEDLPIEAATEPGLPAGEPMPVESAVGYDDSLPEAAGVEEDVEVLSHNGDQERQAQPRNWFDRLVHDDRSSAVSDAPEIEESDWQEPAAMDSGVAEEFAEARIAEPVASFETSGDLDESAEMEPEPVASAGETADELESVAVASAEASQEQSGDARGEQRLRRPLSFAELRDLRLAEGGEREVRESAAIAPPEVAESSSESAAAESVAIESVAAAPRLDSALRWDPIPPLRDTEEPWRISRSSMPIAVTEPNAAVYDVWGAEDPVRIAPVDRWSDSAAAEPALEQAGEGTDIVLTRRWGLLSRFQQGESFQAARLSAREQEGEEAAAAAGSELPAADRRRR